MDETVTLTESPSPSATPETVTSTILWLGGQSRLTLGAAAEQSGGRLRTVMVTVSLCEAPSLSVTRKASVYVPATANEVVCVLVVPYAAEPEVSKLPSPSRSHSTV